MASYTMVRFSFTSSSVHALGDPRRVTVTLASALAVAWRPRQYRDWACPALFSALGHFLSSSCKKPSPCSLVWSSSEENQQQLEWILFSYQGFPDPRVFYPDPNPELKQRSAPQTRSTSDSVGER